MKKIVFTALMTFSFSAFSASIIGYISKDEGEVHYKIIMGNHISTMEYDEGDKVLKVEKSSGGIFYFRVETSSKAKEVISKVLDSSDKSIIELSWD